MEAAEPKAIDPDLKFNDIKDLTHNKVLLVLDHNDKNKPRQGFLRWKSCIKCHGLFFVCVLGGGLYVKPSTFPKQYINVPQMVSLRAVEYFHDFAVIFEHSVFFTIGMLHLLRQKKKKKLKNICKILLPPMRE